MADSNANLVIVQFLQEALQTGQYSEIVEFCDMEFEKSPQLKNDPKVVKILALAQFLLKNYDQSTEQYKVLTQNSTDIGDWFNLTTSAIMAGRTDEGLSAFDHTIELHKKYGTEDHLTPGMMTFYVMCAFRDADDHNQAYVQLDKLGEVYKELHVTDSGFLTQRGLPDFANLLIESIPILEKQPSQMTQLWLKALYEKVDAPGQDAIKKVHHQIFDK